MSPYNYVFPAIRGIQAKREYYVAMCPLKLVPKILIFDETNMEIVCCLGVGCVALSLYEVM